MTSRELRRVADAYGEAVVEKRDAVEDLRDRLDDLEPEELANQGAATLKTDADAVATSIGALHERQSLYIELLRTKVDETKPLADIAAETDGMQPDEVRRVAEAYRDAILKKRADSEAAAKELEAMGPEQKTGTEGRRATKKVAAAAKSDKALRERLDAYIAKVREKGADTTGLTPD
jgi:exonuclease VII large subunit